MLPAADPVTDVRDRRRGDRLDELECRIADLLEQPLAGAEHDRDDVQEQLVEQSGRRYWLTVLAPPATCTSRSPAAARACSA
jgi:hypothetical protein